MSCFIIAECGVNWRDLVDADQMIKEAAEAGADAVKFQAYKVFTSPNSIPVSAVEKHCNVIRLNESTIRYLYWRCQQHGIEFMCTPMYPAAVDMLDPYVKRWKVRYADRDNKEILDKCQKTGKPMLVSGKNIYCCPEYPPKIGEPKNITMGELLEFDGLSNHWPVVEVPASIVEYCGLKYLEVHVRLDKYEPHYCPIDTAVSITMSELKELCRRLKG